MDADRNLLFGVLALQADVITSTQFIDACTAWAARKDVALADLLIDHGWITVEERATVEHLMQLKLKKNGGDPHASLAAVADDPVHRALAEIDSPEVRATLTALR